MKLSKLIPAGLLSLCLLGCGSRSAIQHPPLAWTDRVEHPQPDGRDNGAMARLVSAYRAALTEANGRLDDLREWYGTVGR